MRGVVGTCVCMHACEVDRCTVGYRRKVGLCVVRKGSSLCGSEGFVGSSARKGLSWWFARVDRRAVPKS